MGRRRKLSKEYEKLISTGLKEIELINAKINDIEDDDIRQEYSLAFARTKIIIVTINSKYKEMGYTDQSDKDYQTYLNSLESFKSEYEI